MPRSPPSHDSRSPRRDSGRGTTFRGQVTDLRNPHVVHCIEFSIDAAHGLSGTSRWPPNGALGLAARSFALRGRARPDRQLEFADDSPERAPGFRRGLYAGGLSARGARLRGQYYEFDEASGQLFYFGDWTATRLPKGRKPARHP